MIFRKSKRNYVDDLLIFRPDIRLTEMTSKPAGLAASGGRQKYQLLRKLGSLRDNDNQVLVKVYEDTRSDEYHVFFLFNRGDPKFVIISHPDIYKYYVMKSDGSIVIPKSAGIDPLHDRLNVSFPIDVFQTDLQSLTDEPESLLTGEMGSELSYAYHAQNRSLELTVSPSLSGEWFDGTKILISALVNEELQGNPGLFPLRDQCAKIILPPETGESLTLCIYR